MSAALFPTIGNTECRRYVAGGRAAGNSVREQIRGVITLQRGTPPCERSGISGVSENRDRAATLQQFTQGSETVSRQPHKLESAGSIPAPAPFNSADQQPRTPSQAMAHLLAKSEEVPSGCREWQAGLNSKGYGQMRFRSERLCHRVMWTLVNGPIPEGLNILHSCDNPLCINPRHLFAGTQQDNMTDMAAKGRARGGVSYGEKHPGAKLADADVAEIRRRRADGESTSVLAAEFSLSPSYARKLIRGDYRSHAAANLSRGANPELKASDREGAGAKICPLSSAVSSATAGRDPRFLYHSTR